MFVVGYNSGNRGDDSRQVIIVSQTYLLSLA